MNVCYKNVKLHVILHCTWKLKQKWKVLCWIRVNNWQVYKVMKIFALFLSLVGNVLIRFFHICQDAFLYVMRKCRKETNMLLSWEDTNMLRCRVMIGHFRTSCLKPFRVGCSFCLLLKRSYLIETKRELVLMGGRRTPVLTFESPTLLPAIVDLMMGVIFDWENGSSPFLAITVMQAKWKLKIRKLWALGEEKSYYNQSLTLKTHPLLVTMVETKGWGLFRAGRWIGAAEWVLLRP
jgi:hypothetical protein